VKLLFDQNISHRLLESLASLYPDSSHVRLIGLKAADDELIWAFAREHGFTIVSKDSDFHQRSLLFGFPPKVIWIRRGNCNTEAIDQILRERRLDIERFHSDKRHAYLPNPSITCGQATRK
jgi:predicted nuclease of predicted toxin-antitoxin system